MRKLTTEQQFREEIVKDQLTVAVFKTTWCKDCHFINPFMPELTQYYAERVAFVEVDRDDLPDVCSELNILGIPSFIAFREGRELARFVSKLRKTREEIEGFVDKVIAIDGALQERE